MPRTAAFPLAAVPVVLAAVLVSACGSSSSGSGTSAGAAAAGYGAPAATTQEAAAATTAAAAPAAAARGSSMLHLAADASGALKFNTQALSAKAGKVSIVMRNPSGSGLPHGIAIEGNGVDKDGPTVQPGGTSTDTVTLKPGTYTFYCPVPGHKAAGMKGTLTVT